LSFEILTYGFMQRAIISGIAIAILCSVVGLFLVLRRYSLFGDAIAHSSFGGIALGLMAGIYPLWTAYAVSLGSALVITRIRNRFKISGDASVAVLLSSGIAVGLVLISLSGGFTIDIFSFLFGSILLISTQDTVLILGLTGVILVVILLLYRQLVYSTFNEEQAQVSGIPVEKINYLIVFLAGITVVTSITSQNTKKFSRVEPVSTNMIQNQINIIMIVIIVSVVSSSVGAAIIKRRMNRKSVDAGPTNDSTGANVDGQILNGEKS